MENQNSLINWIGEHANPLKLEVVSSTWIDGLLPGSSDLSVTIEIEEKKYIGLGFGSTQSDALIKGFAEAVERVVLSESDFFTSNGIAAHLSREKAERAAKNELLERDLLLAHFYTGTSFEKIQENELPKEVGSFAKKLGSLGIRLGFFKLGANGAIVFFFGKHFNNSFGFTVGSAIKDNFELSLKSASVEAGRRAHRLIEGFWKLEPISIEDFLKIESPKFHDHGQLAASLEYSELIESLLFQEDGSKPEKQVIVEPRVNTIELVPQNNLLKGCPLFFAKAESDEVQDLFLGAPTPTNLNFKRLSAFAGREINWENLPNKLPHFMD